MNRINFITNDTNLFHIFVYVPLGSIYEDEKVNGISHLLEHMLFKHTKKYNEEELLKEITSLGGNYNATTDKDVTMYFIMTNGDSYKKAIDILHSMVCEPVFTQSELDMERKVVLEEISKHSDYDDIYKLTSETILEKGNKYLLPVGGNETTLNNITLGDIKKYYKKYYKNFSVFVNSDKKYINKVKKYVFKVFGSNKIIDNDNHPDLKCTSTKLTNMLTLFQKNSKQYSTVISLPSFPKNMVKENIILEFIKYCLISSGLYSIILYQLRAKRGLVYSLYSVNETYRFIGLFKIYINTLDHKTDYILSIIFNIISKMKKKGFSNSILQKYKKSYLNEQKYAFTNDYYNTIFTGEAIFYNSFISKEDYFEFINNISNDDIIKIANQIFDFSKMGILTYGKYANISNMENQIVDITETYKNLLLKKDEE